MSKRTVTAFVYTNRAINATRPATPTTIHRISKSGSDSRLLEVAVHGCHESSGSLAPEGPRFLYSPCQQNESLYHSESK